MFNNKKIKELEKRIADLESPYLYEIGEEVHFHIKGHLGITYTGVIVNRYCRYPYGIRENEYLIFYDNKNVVNTPEDFINF